MLAVRLYSLAEFKTKVETSIAVNCEVKKDELKVQDRVALYCTVLKIVQ